MLSEYCPEGNPNLSREVPNILPTWIGVLTRKIEERKEKKKSNYVVQLYFIFVYIFFIDENFL